MAKTIIKFLAINPTGWPPKEVRQELKGIEIETIDEIRLKSLFPAIPNIQDEDQKPIVILKSNLLAELQKQRKKIAFDFYKNMYPGDYVSVNPDWCEIILEPQESDII